MNTRPAIEDSVLPGAISVAFNQDSSCFSVGLDTGFCIFNSDPCQLKVSREFNAGLGPVQMLGRANYVALVGGGKQPKFPQTKVVIWDDSKQRAIINLEFRTAVRGVRLTRSHIVVVLQNSVHVHIFSAQPERVSVFETADNPLGLCSLSAKSLAFPGRTPGQIQMVELSTGNVSIIPAHSSALHAVEISPDGEILATASETGTLVRIFATSNCAKIAELRRGVDHAVIFSLAFSPSSQLLAVTSDKSTLHIFDIPHPTKLPRPDPHTVRSGAAGLTNPGLEEGASHKWGILGKIPLLPRVFSDVYSFASARFEIGDDLVKVSAVSADSNHKGRYAKGIVGWVDEQTIIVVGAGTDARWEKFLVVEGADGKRYCIRDGWKKYLAAS